MILELDARIYVAGHEGMVGSAIMRLLTKRGFQRVITASRAQLDLRHGTDVRAFFEVHRPEYVIIAAAKVGGIGANIAHQFEFLLDNMLIQNNLISSATDFGVRKVIFLGSSCIYPKECSQPMKEEYLLGGPLEPTNEGYALAKITALNLLQYASKQFGLRSLSVIPCNLYGTNDSFDPISSHVLSALVRKFVDAVDDHVDRVEVWGTGNARREFMHVEDFAEALLFLENKWLLTDPINVGTGLDISIRGLAELVSSAARFSGAIIWDLEKPDGMMKKCLDVSKLTGLGYVPKISLESGLMQTIDEYRLRKSKGLR